MTADIKHLREPFKPEQIGKLPKPTKKDNRKGECAQCGGWHGLPAVHLDFVGHALVTERLNAAAPGWEFAVGEPVVIGAECYVRVTLTIDGVSREEYGDGPDPKQAVSNGLRRAAMRFGVALELWSKEELSGARPDNAAAPAPAGSTDSVGQAAAERVEGESDDAAAVPQGSGAPVAPPSTERPGSVAGEDTDSGKADGGDGASVEPPEPPSAAPGEAQGLVLSATGSATKARNALNRANGTGFTAKTEHEATEEMWRKAFDDLERAS